MTNKNQGRKRIDKFFESNKNNFYTVGCEGTDFYGTDYDSISSEDTCLGWMVDPREGVILAEIYKEHEYVFEKYFEQYENYSYSDRLGKVLLMCSYVVAREGGLLGKMIGLFHNSSSELKQEIWFLSGKSAEEVKRGLNSLEIDGRGSYPIFKVNEVTRRGEV